MPEAISV